MPRQGGRPRKPGKREPNGQIRRDTSPNIAAETEARRRHLVGNSWRDPDAGWLIGCWYLRGELRKPHEKTDQRARERRDAAKSYLSALADMCMVLGVPQHRDSLGNLQPKGQAPDLPERRISSIFIVYHERVECLRRAGERWPGTKQAVEQALQDDWNTSREQVIEGLDALIDAGLT